MVWKVLSEKEALGQGLGGSEDVGDGCMGNRESTGPEHGVLWPVKGTAGGQGPGTQAMR